MVFTPIFSRLSYTYVKYCQSILFANYFSKMEKTAILLLAEGAEEMEAIITADVLRRAGVSVVMFRFIFEIFDIWLYYEN